jgi:hypothetical protein
MGPTCEVLLESASPLDLDAVDALLASTTDQIERTRKGRVWNVWLGGRPIHIEVLASPPSICLSAGCNSPTDTELLRQLARKLADALGGLASAPIK